jgi:hypothetical protein
MANSQKSQLGNDQENRKLPKDLDLLEIPLEGVAAYWLSLKKVLLLKKHSKLLEEESQYTQEPYIKHLLQISFASFSEEQIRKYAGIKQETILKDLKRKIYLMLIGLLGIATDENPQQVLLRFISKFPISPIIEKQIFEKARDYLEQSEAGDLNLDIDHRMNIDTLITHLIFFSMFSRRKGKESCAPLINKVRSLFFKEGMELIIDGFDYDFIKHRLTLQESEILYETKRKMHMSLEMCLAIKANMAYDDVFKIANSFLL